MYWILQSGQEIQSPRSNSISVVRTESPQPPVLSVQPQFPVYIQGEEVTFTCSAPGGLARAGYELYEEIGGQDLNVHLSHRHTFKLKGKTARGNSCTYWALVSGRKIRSQRSNSIFLEWTDPLPPPVLDINPPPRAVYEGEPLLISCLSSSSSNMEKRFHFYRDGVEMDFSNEESQQSSREPGDPSPDAALRIPQFNSNHSGEFACSYEENMKGRWIPSPYSQKVNLTVQPRDSSGPVLMYVRLAFVLLIPLILLVYYYHPRMKRVWKSEEAFQPQESKEETEFIN
ncbi:low affinity immunoglobulin gamma Fc region receptor II-like [Tiliqua scincoides]|uniref:low affinity immunoglobulin gamma Fc region receptor II-like n=1 Tax=Tiliqua scincoides TaxID=71010 RepID=UPI0034618CE5